MTKECVFDMLDDYYTYAYSWMDISKKYSLTYKQYRKYVLKYKSEYAKERGVNIR